MVCKPATKAYFCVERDCTNEIGMVEYGLRVCVVQLFPGTSILVMVPSLHLSSPNSPLLQTNHLGFLHRTFSFVLHRTCYSFVLPPEGEQYMFLFSLLLPILQSPSYLVHGMFDDWPGPCKITSECC